MIRPARAEDAAGIADVHIRSWQWAYRGLLPDKFLDGLTEAWLERRKAQWLEWLTRPAPGHASWVAVAAGLPIGFASSGIRRDEDLPESHGEVYTIYLLEEAIGKGIGRQLLTTAMAHLSTLGCPSASLWVLERNTRARRFYEAAGWLPDGKSQQLQIGGATAVEIRYQRAALTA